MPRLGFDVDVDDHASSTLRRIGHAFRGLARDADDAGRDSGRGFGAGFKRWWESEGKHILAGLGHNVGGRFGSSIIDALNKPGFNGPLLAVLGGTLLAVAGIVGPGVGAVLAGGVVAGFGGGLAALGLVFAAKSDAVTQAWDQMLENMGADMQILSRPFEATLVDLIGVARRTFAAFKPALGSAFQSMAPVISRFGDQLGHAFERLIPAIGPLTDAFNKILDTMGPALSNALGTISTALIRLSESVKANPGALADLISGLGSLTSDLLGLFQILNDINAQFEKLTGGLSAVDATMALIRAPVVALSGAFAGEKLILTGLTAVLDKTTSGVDASGASMNAAADMVTKNAQAMQKDAHAADALQGPLSGVSEALGAELGQFSSTIQAMGQWANKALAASNAAISYEAALDDATAALKKNGRTIDISTEKGRANRTALNNLAEAAMREAEAMDEAGYSNQAVSRKAELSRAAFQRLAEKMGYSKAQARALALQLINIPNVSRTVTITRRNITYNDIITRKSTGEFQGGQNARAHAAGGDFLANEVIRVGEQGEELAVFDRPGRIVPNDQVRAASAGGGATEVNLRIDAGGSQLDQMLLAVLKKAIRVRGGNVQLVLGS